MTEQKINSDTLTHTHQTIISILTAFACDFRFHFQQRSLDGKARQQSRKEENNSIGHGLHSLHTAVHLFNNETMRHYFGCVCMCCVPVAVQLKRQNTIFAASSTVCNCIISYFLCIPSSLCGRDKQASQQHDDHSSYIYLLRPPSLPCHVMSAGQ